MTLIDRFGRRHEDLRISLTDKCNLRCRYCVDGEVLSYTPAAQVLRADEIVRIARVAIGCGIRQIRLTGGEPLLHPQCERIVRDISGLLAVEGAIEKANGETHISFEGNVPIRQVATELSMTTNATLLADRVAKLHDAGLRRINISLDSLRSQRFHHMAGRPALAAVQAGIRAAQAAGLAPVKLNTVVIRGYNDDELPDLLQYAMAQHCEIRFIEHMPMAAQLAWHREKVVTAAEMIETLANMVELTPLPRQDSSPAQLFRINGGPQRVGFISSVSAPFCSACNRLRLTADGKLRSCLFTNHELDIAAALRSGAHDAQLAQLFQEAVAGKAESGIQITDIPLSERPMYAIGG